MTLLLEVIVFVIIMKLATPHARVAVLPTSFTATVGGIASFDCTEPDIPIMNVQWTLNGTLLTELNITGVEATLDSVGWMLQFTNLTAELNQTRIGCIATFQSGETVTPATTLLNMQGLLGAVGNLILNVQDSGVFANWTAPFTLDISNVEDDISGYCIDIINFNTSSTLFSECGINTTEFSLTLSLDVCYTYMITVTPVNVVGPGDGKSLTYSESCVGTTSDIVATQVTKITSDKNSCRVVYPVGSIVFLLLIVALSFG